MGFRLRKSINLGAGIRLNLSKSGVGMSAGVKGFRAGVNSKGQRYTNASLPGTGISYRTTSSVSSNGHPAGGTPPHQTNPNLTGPELEAASILQQATAALNQGDYQRALALVRQAEELDPTNSKVDEVLGATLNNLGQHEEAVRYLERYTAVDLSNHMLVYGLAACYYNLKEYDKGIRTINELPESVRSTDLTALRVLALCYGGKKDYATAIEVLRRAPIMSANPSPELQQIIFTLGEAYELAGDPLHAQRCFRHIEEVNPSYPGVADKLRNSTAESST